MPGSNPARPLIQPGAATRYAGTGEGAWPGERTMDVVLLLLVIMLLVVWITWKMKDRE